MYLQARLRHDACGLCRTASAPLGYSLPAFPWYIDQSIGGAVATGSHGSSMLYGSLASQASHIYECEPGLSLLA